MGCPLAVCSLAQLSRPCVMENPQLVPKSRPRRFNRAMTASWPAISIAANSVFLAFLPKTPGLGVFLKIEVGVWLVPPL